MRSSNLRRRGRILALALIALVGVSLQLGMIFKGPGGPNRLSWDDPKHYYSIASSLSEGKPYSLPGDDKSLWRSPGYPFFLSLLMRGFGKRILTLKLLHVLLCPLFLLAIYGLGSELGNRRIGLLAMLFAAVYPLFVYIPVTLYSESLSLLLYAVIALVMIRARGRGYAMIGLLSLLIACAVMVRPTSAIWIPVSLYYLLSAKRLKPGRAAVACAILIIIPVVFAGSWMARNKRVHGRYIFTTMASFVLVHNYNENATAFTKQDLRLPPDLDRRLKSARSYEELDRIAQAEFESYVRRHPWRTVGIAAVRMVDLWNPMPRTIIKSGIAQTKFKIVSAVPYAMLLPFSIAGFVMSRKSRAAKAFFWLLVLNTVVNGPMNVSVRYRAVTDFVILVMAAFALNTILTRLHVLDAAPIGLLKEPEPPIST